MNKSITQDMAYRQSLMKYAEKYGISRDRLTVSSMQDKEQPFQTNDWNRVVIIIAD